MEPLPYLEKCLPLLRRPFINFPRLHYHPYSWLSGMDLPATLLDHGWGEHISSSASFKDRNSSGDQCCCSCSPYLTLLVASRRIKWVQLACIKTQRLSLYREFQLLTDEYSNLLASYHAMLHGVVVALVTLCVYLFVRTEGMMAALAAYIAIWSLPTYCELMNNYSYAMLKFSMAPRRFWNPFRASCYFDGSGNPVRTRRGASDAGTAIRRR